MVRIVQILSLLGAGLATAAAHAGDNSSWSSGTITAPNQRPGDAKLLKAEPARKTPRPASGAERAPIGPVAAPTETLSTFKPAAPDQDAVRGTGVLATTTVAKTPSGADAAYDAFDQGRFLTALDLATKAAATGDPQAHTLIGRLHQEGLGIKQDAVEAAQWYRKAAELGDIEGTFAFAVMLADGDGIQKNRIGAAQLFDRAAQQGHVLANYNLALLFLKGDGKPENPHRAAQHLRYAAERGVAPAQYDLATLYATGTGVAASAYEAANWLAKAAEQGYVDAEVEYAVWLFQGRGVVPSQSRGAQFFRSAAEKGVAVAQNRLARCYANGAGVPADLLEAAKWHLIAKAGGVDDVGLELVVSKLPRADRAKVQLAAEALRDAIEMR